MHTSKRETAGVGTDTERSSAMKHAEAYALMMYECKDCGHRERIWNSRDGVTPFAMGCVKCKTGTATHGNWRADKSCKDYRPVSGEYFWRDGTSQEASDIMRERIESMQIAFPVDRDTEIRLINDAAIGAGEFQKGWPMLERKE